MADYDLEHGTVERPLRVFLRNATTGGGAQNILNTSDGLGIRVICDNEAAPTVYYGTDDNIETIATLGVYAAPSTGKIRFKATPIEGLYEIQLADSHFAVVDAQQLDIIIDAEDCETARITVALNRVTLAQQFDYLWGYSASPFFDGMAPNEILQGIYGDEPLLDPCTMHIAENDVPIEGVLVWVTSDAQGLNKVRGALRTDASGNVTFLLDEGTGYYLWAQKTGMNPILGQYFEAEADE